MATDNKDYTLMMLSRRSRPVRWLKLPADIYTPLLMVAVFALSMAMSAPVAAQAKLAKFGVFSQTRQIDVDHGDWNDFLVAHIRETADVRTIINYGGVSDSDKSALKTYIASLEAIDTAQLTKPQAYAYWVNFYNALTVEVILDKYPLKSIRSLGFGFGPWGQKLTRVNNTRLTLNNIEHDILRVYWRDPRTHYAVNCASYGCPNLQGVAFTQENTEELLRKGAHEFVNHPRGIRVTDKGAVRASSIYQWYKVDFGDSEEGILDHAREYANDELAAALEGKTSIAGYDYDWALNEK